MSTDWDDNCEFEGDYCDYDDFGDDDPDTQPCHTCRGDGYGIVGTDWDCTDGINGPYPGETEKCWNCHGSGLEKDCWIW